MDAQPLEGLLAELARMPECLEHATAGVDDEKLRRQPADGRFSLIENVWHLADLERDGYAARIARLRDEVDPLLADFDGARVARERNYRALPLRAGLDAFAAARAHNLRALRALSDAEWGRGGQQQGVGAVRLEDIPRMMVEHDAGHRAEILGARAGDERGEDYRDRAESVA